MKQLEQEHLSAVIFLSHVEMLEDLEVSVDIADTPTDYKLEEEFVFTAYNEFPENVNVTQRQIKTHKILRKYWNE